MKINLLSHDNGVGLTQDVKIVKSILEPEYECTFIDLRYGVPLKADINIFFEILDNRFYSSAKKNLFFPNPEWFWWPGLLKQIDLVLCKTHDAERIFKLLECKTRFTSFTSADRQIKGIQKERAYLHTAGQSRTKGTDAVWTYWKETYPLMIFTKLQDFGNFKLRRDNVYTCFQRLPDEVLFNLQNKCTFHLCPSEYEGFGHYIWEAKSCGGIVLTTNAPPMKEMVTEDDGFLIKVKMTKKMNFGRLQMIDGVDFQRVVEQTMELTDEQIESMQTASRKRWEDNDRFFKNELRSVIFSML